MPNKPAILLEIAANPTDIGIWELSANSRQMQEENALGQTRSVKNRKFAGLNDQFGVESQVVVETPFGLVFIDPFGHE